MTDIDLSKEIQKVGEMSRRTNELLEKLGVLKEFADKEAVIFDKEIVKFGERGAHMTLPEKYIGHKATLIIKKRSGGQI